MGGPGKIIQIDESYFNGKRKNNKGRKLLYDKLKGQMDADKTGSSSFNVSRTIENNSVTTFVTTTLNDDDENIDDNDDTEDIEKTDDEESKTNFPWVFGMCEKRDDGRNNTLGSE